MKTILDGTVGLAVLVMFISALISSKFRNLQGVLIKFCIPLVCFVVLGISQLAWSAIITYDLKTNWSDTNNPNGVWTFKQGASILPHNDVSACCAGLTGGWAPGAVAGNFLPFWAKATGNNYGFLAGDIVVHSVDVSNGKPALGESNVTWTAPATGIIDLNLSLWYAHLPIVRSNDFILSLNATALTSGTINPTNSDRTHPLTFIKSGLNVNAGDVLQLRVQQSPNQPAGSFAGVNLSITLQEVSPSTTLSASPGTIAQGGTATAAWSAIAAPTNRDWIALSTPGAVDTAYFDWIYVSCSKSAGAAPANGSCPFLIPSSLPNGTYQLRLFTNNGYTRLATSNSFIVAPVPPPSLRFVDNNDGTITDDQTGLQWEKKTACTGPSATDIHCVNNTYRWSSTLPSPDGTLFTDFLARINKVFSTSGDGITVADVCFAGYCDWRVPNIAELRTIVLAACPGGASPCIDPIFGPTSTGYYWSSTTIEGSPNLAWSVNFGGGFVLNGSKIGNVDVRAVRGGL